MNEAKQLRGTGRTSSPICVGSRPTESDVRRRIIAEAEADIEQARRILKQQSSEVANRFFAELEEALERMMEQPSSFPPLETLETGLADPASHAAKVSLHCCVQDS